MLLLYTQCVHFPCKFSINGLKFTISSFVRTNIHKIIKIIKKLELMYYVFQNNQKSLFEIFWISLKGENNSDIKYYIWGQTWRSLWCEILMKENFIFFSNRVRLLSKVEMRESSSGFEEILFADKHSYSLFLVQ